MFILKKKFKPSELTYSSKHQVVGIYDTYHAQQEMNELKFAKVNKTILHSHCC